MARPHIEFLQSQQLAWGPSSRLFTGAEAKRLSADGETGAETLLLRWPAGHRDRTLSPLAESVELFVLDGALTLAGRQYGTHDYGYLPAGAGWSVATGSRGAVVLAFTGGRAGAPGPEPAIGPLSTWQMPWDRTNVDPEIDHLQAARKNLRHAPDGGCRTYLLGGMPHGFPKAPVALERHPHVEEFFLISGDVRFHVGPMHAGAYFWRPPGLWHGQDCTRSGYLLFCRTPGSNRTISEWSSERHRVDWDPPYRPVLPLALAQLAAQPPLDPVQY